MKTALGSVLELKTVAQCCEQKLFSKTDVMHAVLDHEQGDTRGFCLHCGWANEGTDPWTVHARCDRCFMLAVAGVYQLMLMA